MKCPHCDYVYDASIKYPDQKGEFFRHPIDVERPDLGSYHSGVQKRGVYGCPNCNKMFIDMGW